ncbi:MULTISPECIES: TetR/AcrR family transcriptional regulator [Actinoalloteichus]|uniref:Transcriptional regulator, TetR family n=1 Tax=Actinoalloteichus fjordicus TaxID=1612552 RepID=A0AAC9PSG4_9PSEU|nr:MULTISPECIES: TetR family transcriptional regulator [Actinoalloteichus]APU15113.1 transcriptional regulator, TetR family [Actinoalloteichus fjordicus]APU21181.1 transcriptional regulator, TetR family [Actinoalloteichus sp. GBA129-24]
MRPSSRTAILDAAIRVTERAGITGLTLDAAAEEAGVTKGGLLYHFHTRDDLLLAIQQRITDQWEERLLAELGMPRDEATPQQRAAAYARLNLSDQPSSTAELAFMLESANHPALAEVWNELTQRWVPAPTSPESATLNLFLARLAADGLWLLEATKGTSLTPAVREAVTRRITALIEPPSDPAES